MNPRSPAAAVCVGPDQGQGEVVSQANGVGRYHAGLHLFAAVWVVVTFCLLILGGTVTSKGVGLAVPDWPTTFDYNMFLFPPSMWKGGIFWEHTHRLLGSVVGVMTIVMAVWLWMTQRYRRWLAWLGVASLVMVIVQGVMGGLRVTELDYRWGVAHGVLGQVFLCVTVLITAATSRYWSQFVSSRNVDASHGGSADVLTRRLSWVVLGVMFIQLVLGAAMRHSGAGLAIPDFPSSYGRMIPPMTQQGVQAAVDALPYDQVTRYYTPAQVGLNFAHRVWAWVVVGGGAWFVARIIGQAANQPLVKGPLIALIGLLLSQLALGASVVWSGRHPEIATAHQATGAALLATMTLLMIRVHLSPSGCINHDRTQTNHVPTGASLNRLQGTCI